ncbi:MAG: hypothetical protein EP330_10725 [Deltaproteobacteria bacterium]|nr:MAG: hypothetical protein EP330_10725 [Deltaproteobacteria bacterium]
MPASWGEARERLLPVVRGICRPPGSLTRLEEDPRHAPIRRPVAPFLSELVVWDGDETRRYVTPEHLERWGIDGHRAFHAARANLAPTEGLTRDGPFFRLDAGDGYESSRLLLPGWLRAFEDLVPGQPLAAAPDARTLLVCGSDDEDAVSQLAEYAFRAYRNAGDPVSPGLYTEHEGQLVPWLVHHGSLAPVLRRNQLVLAGQQYRLQQHEVTSDTHLADFSVFVGPEFAVSLAQLPPDRPVLLPVVDFIVVLDPSGESRTVAWEALMERAEVEPALEMVPPRVAVRSRPPLVDLPEAPIRVTLK